MRDANGLLRLWALKASAGLMFLLGPHLTPLAALLALGLLDVVLGTAVAIMRREWEADIGVRRVIRKFTLLAAAVLMARLVEIALVVPAESTVAIVRWLIGYLAVHEGVSITAHIEALGGPPLLTKLRDRLQALAQSRGE